MAYIDKLFADHFLQYASYVIRDRAIPSLADGLKPVQRRILQSLWDMDDGKFHKVANVVGHCMQYHPHGDASIYGALVNLANKELLLEKQGNFGNIYTGDPASAARYIECRLSALARRTLFNPDVTEFLPSYDGRRQEPVALPAKLPFLLLLGTEGIAVGMSTRILPHNFDEVIAAMCAELNGQDFELWPDFLTGGLLDISQYNCGNGKVLARARLECKENQITIRALPYGVTTEALIESLDAAVRKGRLKIQNIQNFTAEEVEIVLQLPRGLNAAEQLAAIYAFSDCEVSISCNLLTIDDKHPREMDTKSVLRYSCKRLKEILQAELQLAARDLQAQIFGRKLERIFIEERLYKRLEELPKLKEIETSILAGLEPYCKQGGELGRPVTRAELALLLRIPIRRISRYDIARVQRELRSLEKRRRQVEKHLNNLTQYALSYLNELRREFGPAYRRQTELGNFARVAARKVAKRDRILYYDSREGFLGYALKTGLALFACSPYDRILLLLGDGCYSIFGVPEKLFVGKEVAFCNLAEKSELAKLESAVIYRDDSSGYSYAKRLRFGGHILGKEYHLWPQKERDHNTGTMQCFVAVSSERSAELRSLQDKFSRAAKESKEQSIWQEQILHLKNLPLLLAQPAANAAAFSLLFEGGEENNKQHYRFGDLPEKTTKARGQLLRRARVRSIELLSGESSVKKQPNRSSNLSSRPPEHETKNLF